MKTKSTLQKKMFSKASWVLFSIGVLGSFTAQATGDTLFVDDYFHAAPKKACKYHIVREDFQKHRKQSTWTENVYYANGTLISTYPVLCYKDGHPEKNGLYKEFYPNGNVKKGINYDMGKQLGEYSEYFPDGKLKLKGKVENGQTFVYNIYDTLSQDQLQNGNGLVVSYDSTWGCLSYYEVKDSLRGHTFYIDTLSHDTVYTALENELGMKIKTILISDVPYNISKKYMGQKLYVACLVNENGHIMRTSNKNSLHPKLDYIMMEKVKVVTGFNPPTLSNGKKVKTAVIIPLTI